MSIRVVGLIAISGIFYPITSMPPWLQWIAQVFPIYWPGLGMRSALLPASSVGAEIGNSWRHLETVGVLGAWALLGLIVAPIVLGRMARRESADAAAVFARGLALREAIERIFRRIAHSGNPREVDLAFLEREFEAALASARLTVIGNRYAWSWDRTQHDIGKPLWLVTQSAVDLLTEGELSRIRECPGAGDCGWLFYDTSRNGTRRWCSMEGCGSRVKMRRQYARRRQADMARRV